MWVSPEALKQWDKLCPRQSLGDLRKMVRQAAPVSNPKGNRRYKEFIFKVSKKQIIGVFMLHANIDCDFCGGRGYTVMNDHLMNKEVQIPCHVCGEGRRG